MSPSFCEIKPSQDIKYIMLNIWTMVDGKFNMTVSAYDA